MLNTSNNEKLMSSIDGHVYKRFHSRKHHAKSKGIEFSISYEYALSIVTKKCPVLNIDMSWCAQNGKINENSPSLDRIDPSNGYVEGNVAWISYKANRIKNDGTIDDHKAIYEWMNKVINK